MRNSFKWSKYRRNSSPEACQSLVEDFLNKLDELVEDYNSQFPSYFFDAINLLTTDLNDPNISKFHKQMLWGLKNSLENYLKMDVYSLGAILL